MIIRYIQAHDHKGRLFGAIGEDTKFNPRLGSGKTKKQFVEIMKNLNLSNPSKCITQYLQIVFVDILMMLKKSCRGLIKIKSEQSLIIDAK